MLNPDFKRSPAMTGISGISNTSTTTQHEACTRPLFSSGSRIRSFGTALVWIFLFSTQAWSQTVAPSYTWASNLLPALTSPNANAACAASWTQWELLSGWAAIYGYGRSGWNYSRYEGGATEGGCVALYWYPQVGPPKPGDTAIFYRVYSAPTCPANSTGTTTCTCNTGYVPNPLKTECVKESLTISLSGLGGEIVTNSSRAADALVMDGTKPKSGAQVNLTLTVVPEEDGYNHAVGQHTAPHIGSLNPTAGTTGSDGKFRFYFIAPSAGGIHTITATCVDCSNQATGTIKVSSCRVPPLTPLTDPVAIDFDNNVGSRWRPEGLTAGFRSKLTCVQNAITAAGGTSVGTSAYRPEQYQRHLYEIIKKDVELDTPYMTAHPECQERRDEITRKMGPSPGHALQYDQDVALPGTSRHESGTAFDLTPKNLTEAQLTPIYAGCGVTHTAVPGEPWHTQ